MKVIDPGHRYALDHLDDDVADVRVDASQLIFVKRIGAKFPGNTGPSESGTTTQEVLRALIDRTKYVDGQRPDPVNYQVIKSLRLALVGLEMRAARERGDHDSTISIVLMIEPENEPTCPGCGHLLCKKVHDE